jgi:hypothetical protein
MILHPSYIYTLCRPWLNYNIMAPFSSAF